MTRLKRLQEKGRSRKKETIRPVRFTFKTSEGTARDIEQLKHKLGRSQPAVLDCLVLIGLNQARKEGYLAIGVAF